jgi:hypothetical protein
VLLRFHRAAALAAGKEKKKAAETKKTVKVRSSRFSCLVHQLISHLQTRLLPASSPPHQRPSARRPEERAGPADAKLS